MSWNVWLGLEQTLLHSEFYCLFSSFHFTSSWFLYLVEDCCFWPLSVSWLSLQVSVLFDSLMISQLIYVNNPIPPPFPPRYFYLLRLIVIETIPLRVFEIVIEERYSQSIGP